MTYQMALLETKESTIIEMIKNLISVGTPIEYIIKATGWSKEKILQVVHSSDNDAAKDKKE